MRDVTHESHSKLALLPDCFAVSYAQAAAKARRNWRLAGGTLYVTMEPCVMCLSAAQVRAAVEESVLIHFFLFSFLHPIRRRIYACGHA